MKGDIDCENTPESSATRPKPFLVGGSGWHRQVAALHSGGRYVPKGGFVVDFTSRGRYSNEINRKWANSSDDEEQNCAFSGSNNGSGNSVEESETWADRIVLRHTQDVLYELSPPLKTSGVSPVALHDKKLATIDEESSSPPLLSRKEETTTAAEKQRQHNSANTKCSSTGELSNTEKQSWRPPGPCTPPRSFAGRAAALHHHRQSIPNYGKRKQNGKRNSASASSEPHDCANCECCAQLRQNLEVTEAASRQDKAAAAHLRRRLEQEMAKVTKERRDFEAYKEEELKNIRAAAEEIAHKQQRDRLAEGARQRAAAKDISLQDKAEAESLRAELEAARREAGKEAGRHRMEVERLRRKISRMELEVTELSAGIKAAESDRAQAWEESQRYKELAKKKGMAWSPTHQNTTQSCSSSVLGVLSCSPDMRSSCCDDEYSKSNRSESSASSSSAVAGAAAAAAEQGETSAAAEIKNHESTIALPEIARFPNGSIQRTWRDGHISTTFINGDIKQELPSGTTEYFFKEVSVWQVSHPTTGVETFYFPNGRVESHLPVGEDGSSVQKETLLPGGAGALRTFDGGDSRQLPVTVASLRKETLMPRPVPLMSRRK
ncbi:putative Centromere protein J [Nannochloris sp. 'desiccata']|nr:hypothetical protein KSW81_001997 [Chlorella desiccata (nom. nud.)]KAH7622551.1 putative Centromere protein J [Chlorella desiccata (nom. nud.)]